jgi:hypothetical protein
MIAARSPRRIRRDAYPSPSRCWPKSQTGAALFQLGLRFSMARSSRNNRKGRGILRNCRRPRYGSDTEKNLEDSHVEARAASNPGETPPHLVDVRKCLQEIPVAQVGGPLRAILSRHDDRERLPVIAERTHRCNQMCRSVVFGTHEHSNLLARLRTRNALVVRSVSKVKGACR